MIKDILVYVDMDGVVADFEGAVEQRFGKPVAAMSRSEMWSRIIRYDADTAPWFGTLPKMADADDLWAFVTGNFENVEMLTAAGSSPKGAGGQKRKWIGEHFGWDVKVNVVNSAAEKQNYARSHTVLIDDRAKAIDPFVAAGGKGILHTSAANTIAALKVMMEDWQ